MATSGGGSGGSQLFVRQSTGLVREASALDAAIFNAVFSAPVGAALAFGLFWAYSAFPKADLVSATVISFFLNIPVLIMMALLAASMPRTGGDYVWVSRILSPPLAVVSNFAAALSALIGATFWARYFAVSALGPVLVSIGAVTNNQTLIEWGHNFSDQKEHQLWVFLGGFAMIALLTTVLIAGTKSTFRWQNVFFIIATVGTFLAFLVLLFGNNADFTAHFNALNAQFGGGTAADVIGTNAGAAPDVSDLGQTIPAIFVVMTFMMWNWWSVYLSGELKSAANRTRQLQVMFGALIWDVVFISLGAILFFRVVGFDFVVAANSGSTAYAIPSGPFFQLLAALVANIPVLTVLIVGSFLFWSLPAMVGNTFMPIRTVFAWAFDRLLPEKFAEVNERTHSPVPAILLVMAIVTAMLAWSIVSTDFGTWLALGGAGRRGLRPDRVGRCVRVRPAPAGPVPGVAGQREGGRHPGPQDRGPALGAGDAVPGLRRPAVPAARARRLQERLVGAGVHGRDRGHRAGDLLRREVHPPQPGHRHRPGLPRAAPE